MRPRPPGGFVAEALGAERAPELLQVAERLPRHPDGSLHEEVLRLVALNQIDLVATLPETEEARAATARIVAAGSISPIGLDADSETPA